MGRQDRRFGRHALTAGFAAGALVLLGWGGVQGFAQAPPKAEVDSLWPRPLPNHWILGSVTGVAVDSRDHIWVVHRGQASLNGTTESALKATPPGSEYCCMAAPFVLEFDNAGALVSNWGGPGTGYNWPLNPGGIAVDAGGNVWITAVAAVVDEAVQPEQLPLPRRRKMRTS